MIYGCEFIMRGVYKVIEFKAKNENQARMMMMKFAEKNNVYVQNIGKSKRGD